ncbi:MAG: energy transducer TonB, partial [bacterium]|nr:energy transducer TonB [bacterium]
VPSGRLLAPIEIPDEIIEEEFDDLGFDGGSDFGVEGGVENGVPGGVLGGLNDSDHMSDLTAHRISPIQKPKLIRRISPIYPIAALQARLQGTVVIEAVTDIYGKVITARTIMGHPMLKGAATAAVKQWRYEPYILNGVPKPVVFTVTINFRLDNA